MTTTRGTTNGNRRGSSEDRRRRREWLVETYRADLNYSDKFDSGVPYDMPHSKPACRCYRCGKLLTVDTVTVDRRTPGCKGGTYRRDNIRPACLSCNSSTGGKLSKRKTASSDRLRT